jgi:IMP dehydrogenase
LSTIFPDVSRTFNEFMLLPNLTTKHCTPSNVDLSVPIVKFSKGEESSIRLNIPIVSAIMQSVSNDTLAIALAKCGGLSFVYGSQDIQTQVDMVSRVKKHKSGFVVSDSNVSARHSLKDILEKKEKSGHSTIAVTEDGTATGKLLGIVTSRDYRISRDSLDKRVVGI